MNMWLIKKCNVLERRVISHFTLFQLFVFFPVLYTMMQHMYQLRCKRLGIRQHKANRPKKED